MPVQTLGIFDKVFEWVYDKLLDPVINWLAEILGKIFNWVFADVLGPFLEKIFSFVWDYIGVKIANWLFAGVYRLYTGILTIVDCLQYCFDVLIGLQDIRYTDASGVEQSSTLLNYIIFNDTIRTALVAITFIALILTIVFAIYSVIQSTLDFDFENKRPVGRVLSVTLKTMMTFLFIPLIVWVGLNLSSVVLKQTAAALSTQSSGNISISDTIMIVSSSKACKDRSVSFSMNTEPWSSLADGSIGYTAFATEINISEIDYLVGFASSIFCLIVMAICLFSFIRRIYDVVLLYLVSPYFASTMVLDDGQKFSQWRDTFIGKVLLGFGSALGMRLFLLLIPVIMSEDIQFFDNALTEATAGYIMKLIIILGGMYAVHKSSSLLTSIVNSTVAQEEQASNSKAMRAAMKGVMQGGMKGGMMLGSLAAGAISSAMNRPTLPKSVTGTAHGGTAFRDGSTSTGGLDTGGLKINGAKGATAKQSAEWKKALGNLDILDDYEQSPDMHISDVDDMSDSLHNLFGESDGFDPAHDMSEGGANEPFRVSGTGRVDAAVMSNEGFGDDLLANAMDDYIQTPDAPAMIDITENAVFDDYMQTSEEPELRDIMEGVDVFDDYIGTPDAPPLRDITAGVDVFDDYIGTPDAPPLRDITAGVDVFDDYIGTPDAPPLRDITEGATIFDDYTQIPKAPAMMDLTSAVRDDYTRSDHGGISAVGVGGKVFNVPEGYTAFPKLVPAAKAETRIRTMRENAEPQFRSYYDAMSANAGSGGYTTPRMVAAASDSYSSFTKVNGVEMNVPSGYTVVPEIMKISDAQAAAEQYGRGKNAQFYNEFSSNLVTHSFSEPQQAKPVQPPVVYANQIAELEAGVLGAEDRPT